jgi:hemoglobin-like flavoprotein
LSAQRSGKATRFLLAFQRRGVALDLRKAAGSEIRIRPGRPAVQETSMQKASISMVQSHYRAVSGRLEEIVARFYETMFKRHPEVRILFPAEMSRQREHLATALAVVARNIADLAALEGPLMEMGARHTAYGVRPEHYAMVRDTLLDALGWVSGPAWNAELEGAWREALNTISVAMLKGGAISEVLREAETRSKTA